MARREKRIDYVELPGSDLNALEAFYTGAFGWKFVDYGPEYRAFHDGELDGGFYKSELKSRRDQGGTLLVLFAADLESALETVKTHGATIAQEIFSFPGGRRFHFLDPNGNELAVWSE